MILALAIIVLVLSALSAYIGCVNTFNRNHDQWYGFAWFALCMAGLIAARWML